MTNIHGFPLVRRTLIFACALTFSYAGAVMSQDGSRPEVELAQEGLFIQAPELANLSVMNVRVYDQAGELVFSWQSLGEPVVILPRDLPDGVYSFESVAVFDEGGPEQERTVKSYGDFRVDGSLILPGMDDEQAHYQPAKPGIGYRVLGAVLDWLVSDAAAIDLTAEDSPSADVTFYDSAAGAFARWTLSYDHDDFTMFDVFNSNLIEVPIIPFRIDGNTLNHLSFDVRPDGDVSIGEARFWVERSTGDVGIGTTAPNSSLHISAGVPRIRLFDETNSRLGAIIFNDDTFALEGNSFQDVIRFSFDAPADSVFVDSAGDIHLAANKVFIDKAAGPFDNPRIGIGTTTPTASFHISEQIPAIRLTDTSTGDIAQLNFDTNTLSLGALREGSHYRILHMSHDAPANSIVVNASGNVGMGPLTPETALDLRRSDGTATVRVTETLAGPSMPFQGVAQGLVRFELNDEASGKRWRFTNAGNKFAINQVGVAGTEFQVFETGDVLITGALTENSDVNAKQDIVPVDRQDVLAKIARLPIAEWSYKDTPGQRHVGPMAQDFHAAFGLGRNERGISTLDSSGVALAGIQALAEENNRLGQENRALKERLDRLESQQVRLQEVVLQMQDEQRARQVLTSTVLN